MSAPPSIRTLRWILLASLLIVGSSLVRSTLFAIDMGVSPASLRWRAIFLGFAAGISLLVLVGLLTWSPWQPRLLDLLGNLGRLLRRLGPLQLPLAVLLAGFLPLVIFGLDAGLAQELVRSLSWRGMIFWIAVLSGAVLLQARWPQRSFALLLGATALFYGAVYRVFVFLPDLSGYPFSLDWSEASRYFYASLFFAEKVYGAPANPTVLHPTRYMMQSLPFLLPNAPIMLHRLWQVGLWLAMNALAAWLLVRRLRLRMNGRARGGEAPFYPSLMVALWAFLFLLQGPIWYHLLVVVIVVLWGFDSRSFWRSFLVLAVASVWAGMSRVNWIPLPAMLGAMLYFLEQPIRDRPPWQYLAPAALWVLSGGVIGLVSQSTYALLSGNPLDQFGSSFTADLLWYRLFPSATYPLGVLPGILLASLPVFLLAFQSMRGRLGLFHPLRSLGIAAILAVFFAGGLVVSVKIGGGSNLHNMDAYLALLMTAAAYLVADLYIPDDPQPRARPFRPRPAFLALAIAVPIAFAISLGEPRDLPGAEDTRESLQTLQAEVARARQSGGDVLFISERQLLSLGYFGELALVPDYEKVFLMEMAMSQNQSYLQRFRNDLANHRFSLIVASPQRARYQDRADDFGEENNAWVEHITIPILCHYQELAMLEPVRVQLLVPKSEPVPCSGPACPQAGQAANVHYDRNGCVFVPDLQDLSRVRSPEDVARVRQELLDYIWGQATLPAGGPDQIEELPAERYLSAARVEQWRVDMDHGLASTGILVHPENANGDLLIYHEGHDDSFKNHRIRIERFLKAGFAVLAMDMPLTGVNRTDRGPIRTHADLAELPFPIHFFLEPVVRSLNYAVSAYGFEAVYMTGFSGGGWTTVLAAALDTRIQGSYPVAGSYPFYVRSQIIDIEGDFEQNDAGLYRIASYIDLYVLGAAGRRQLQIFNRFSPCCFPGSYASTYQPFVSAAAYDLGGSFGVYLDESVAEPVFSPHAVEVILADIDSMAGEAPP